MQGILSFLYAVIPACLDYGDGSVSSKQWRDSIIRGVYIRPGDTAQQQALCRIQVILVSFPRKSLERQLLRRDNKKHLRLKTKKKKKKKGLLKGLGQRGSAAGDYRSATACQTQGVFVAFEPSFSSAETF